MKEKTSITLSRDVLDQVDRLLGGESRSAFIERVLRGYLRQYARAAANARDLKKLNRAADRLNAEVADVLEYQAGWPEE
ncbi:MAG: ribbon-helix-helix domain-containing protein [Gemmatimonadota bacterium]